MDSNISTYQSQLVLIQNELKSCTENEKRLSLLQLESDLKELIQLTSGHDSGPVEGNERDLDAEYKLFQAELASTDEQTNDETESVVNEIQNDLSCLPGMKCSAPFKHAWCNEPIFHNALIFKVESEEDVRTADDILVRVMFTNPTHTEMKPCPYFLESECKFSDEKCHFSHGEVVPFVSVKEYKEPDFSMLKRGSCVLIKGNDGLWHRGNVLSRSDSTCVVKRESNIAEEEVGLHDMFPLDSSFTDFSVDEASSDDDENEIDKTGSTIQILHNMPSSSALGSWEKYTSGFGSKIMAKMGYIFGTGLGANAEGRIEPVPAVIYPSGKSLDHCMMLKEKYSENDDLFKAERKMQKLQRKHDKALKKSYEKEKQRTDVFTFLNNHMNRSEADHLKSSAPASQTDLQGKSAKVLNVTSLQIVQNVKKIQQEKEKLNESLARHPSSSPAHSTIKDKIRECNDKILQLEASDKRISTELQQRNNRKKLSVF